MIIEDEVIIALFSAPVEKMSFFTLLTALTVVDNARSQLQILIAQGYHSSMTKIRLDTLEHRILALRHEIRQRELEQLRDTISWCRDMQENGVNTQDVKNALANAESTYKRLIGE